MFKAFLIILISLFGKLPRKEKEKLVTFRYCCRLANMRGKPDLLPINEKYEDGANFTLPIDSEVTLNPPNHVAGSTYSVNPPLPPGLTLDPEFGVIYGTPTSTYGPTSHTVTETLSGGDTRIYTFDVTISSGGGGNGGGGFSSSGGKIATESGISSSSVLQTDGKIVLGGYVCSSYTPPSNCNFKLVRYNENGSLDTSFGTSSKLSVSVGPKSVHLLSDNKILTVG